VSKPSKPRRVRKPKAKGTKYENNDDYVYTGGSRDRLTAVGVSEGSLMEAIVQAAEHARGQGAKTDEPYVVLEIAFDIGPNPPISQFRVTVGKAGGG
jgi:hypothetical protein